MELRVGILWHWPINELELISNIEKSIDFKQPSIGDLLEFFLNNKNLTFLYKTDNRALKFQKKIKLPPAEIELTTPTITRLEF